MSLTESSFYDIADHVAEESGIGFAPDVIMNMTYNVVQDVRNSRKGVLDYTKEGNMKSANITQLSNSPTVPVPKNNGKLWVTGFIYVHSHLFQ